MFKLTISLDSTYLDGFAALDRRRVLGMDDHIVLRTSAASVVQVDVTEGFARAWFAPSTSAAITIPLDLLIAEDVASVVADRSYVGLNQAMTPARAMELYIAARFRRDVEADNTTS